MTRTITLEDVRAILKEVVDERPGHTQPFCAYVSKGRFDKRNPEIVILTPEWDYKGTMTRLEIICIAGQVFHRIDPTINAQLYTLQAGSLSTNAEHYPTPATQFLLDWGFSPEAAEYLGHAQAQADAYLPWGTAYEKAEESL